MKLDRLQHTLRRGQQRVNTLWTDDGLGRVEASNKSTPNRLYDAVQIMVRNEFTQTANQSWDFSNRCDAEAFIMSITHHARI